MQSTIEQDLGHRMIGISFLHYFDITAVSPCLGPNRPVWFSKLARGLGQTMICGALYIFAGSQFSWLFVLSWGGNGAQTSSLQQGAKSIAHHTAVFIWALSILIGIFFGCCIAKLRGGFRTFYSYSPLCLPKDWKRKIFLLIENFWGDLALYDAWILCSES